MWCPWHRGGDMGDLDGIMEAIRTGINSAVVE